MNEKELCQLLDNLILDAVGLVIKESEPELSPPATVDRRWVLISSTAFRDRDKDLVTTKALTDDVKRWVDSGSPVTPLRWWHLGLSDDNAFGVDLGNCDYRTMYSKSLIESGTFLTKEIGESVYNNQDKLSGSIGFRFPKYTVTDEKYYNQIAIFERSLLPLGKNSNSMVKLFVF